MSNKARKIRVGLFAIVTLALIALVLIVFGGFRFWERGDRYRVVFTTSIIGLEPGAIVYMNGIKVGTVSAVEIVPSDIQKVVVDIKVKHATPIHADTRAYLQYSGITGLKLLDLRDGTNAAPLLPPGSEIATGVGILDRLEKQAATLVDRSSDLMVRANQVVDNVIALTDPNKLGLDRVVEQSRVTVDNLAETSASLKAMVAENRVALRESIDAFHHTATSANEILDGQVSQILANAGEFVSDLKKLVTTNEGQLRSAVFDLRQASRSFKELARDVRQKPSRLLFSSAPAERKLP